MWMDLTVPNADHVRDFYAKVTGWQSEAMPMDGYADHVMKSPATGAAVAGICHARGDNATLPPQWLIYITVADLAASLRACEELGGKTIVPPREAGPAKYAVIQDPAGAVATLFQPGS